MISDLEDRNTAHMSAIDVNMQCPKFLLSLSFTSKDLDGPPGLHLHYGHDWPGCLEQTHDGQCERRQRDRKQSPEMENKQTNE